MQSSERSTQKTATEKPLLPVDSLLPEIIEFIKSNTLLLLEASPGAGKTTRIPPALLKAGYENILVLEPRRLAARMAAARVAQELSEPPGHTVGYQVRFEELGTQATRIWYLTEGILTRKLLAGDSLPDVQVVILDEFHERHLETDLALALLLRLQKKRRDLKLMIMSATLAAEEIQARFGRLPAIQVPGRVFPVSISYTPHSSAPLEDQVAAAVAIALQKTKQHILVFLPGAAEIRKSLQACESIARPFGADLLALHGDLTPDEQDRAVKPSVRRKIICSTNVAESSVTIEGVQAVVDSGLARVLNHSRLNVEKISQASAIQRSGRAGRTGPGIAIRLFPETDFVRRPAQLQPEILRTDFAPTLLQLTAARIPSAEMTWLQAPTPENVQQARELLIRLGALGADDGITPLGREMARLPLAPRLARFLVAAAQSGIAREGIDFAAALSESRARSDYVTRQLAQQLSRIIRNVPNAKPDPHALEKALLLGFPDRVARKRGEILLMSNGGSARLDRELHVAGEFLLALEIDKRGDQSTTIVRAAAEIKPDWLLDAFPAEVQTSEELTWNREAERVEQRNVLRYRQITIDESSSPARNSPDATEMLITKALEAGIERFTDADALAKFQLRLRFAAEYGNFQIPSDLIPRALREMAGGAVSFAELRNAARDNGFLLLLEAQLPMRMVDQVAPAHITLPSGRRAKIEYHDARAPSVSSRLQDFFGMQTTPTVARGNVPLVVQLLAPNQRPVQVTTDLVSFWKNLYPQLRRELSRRYPRHAWPENPA